MIRFRPVSAGLVRVEIQMKQFMGNPMAAAPGVVRRVAARNLSRQLKIISAMTKRLKTIVVTKNPAVLTDAFASANLRARAPIGPPL